jgi:hypothetical protein
MHAERSHSPPAEPEDVEGAVMMTVLSRDGGLWSRAELEREISGISDNPLDVTDAVNDLHASGLLHLCGELVTPSRAARRMDELRI